MRTRWLPLLLLLLAVTAGCDAFTDAATRLACDIEAGKTVSSHTTSYHARFVDTPKTYILDKPAGSTLAIDIEKRGNRAVITSAR